MKRLLLILLTVFFSSSAVYAVDVWNAVADFNPVNAPQDPNAVWTYRAGGNWNSPPYPSEGTLWPYLANVAGSGFAGYGIDGGNPYIMQPTNGYGGCPADEFYGFAPLVRWLSPINGIIQITGRVAQQAYVEYYYEDYVLSKNGVELDRGRVRLFDDYAYFNETVSVAVGDEIDFKIVGVGTMPYFSMFKETITLAPDPNSPKTLTIITDPAIVDSVSPPVGDTVYPRYTVVDLGATRYNPCPDVYAFDHWEGNVVDPDSPDTTITMAQDETVTAVFLDVRVCGDECHPIHEGDTNGNCKVDLFDLADVAAGWLTCTQPACD